ncbi:MAG: hypothetical protein AAF228_06005 [Pseudomonadota bacterium]
MGTRSFIILKTDNQYKGIYCHWDGYPEHNGQILLNHYCSKAVIDQLVSKGDLSALATSVEACSYYIDRGDDPTSVKPYKHDKIENVIEIAEKSGCEYIYLFEKDEWFIAERGAQFFGLSDGSEFSDFTHLKEKELREF